MLAVTPTLLAGRGTRHCPPLLLEPLRSSAAAHARAQDGPIVLELTVEASLVFVLAVMDGRLTRGLQVCRAHLSPHLLPACR